MFKTIGQVAEEIGRSTSWLRQAEKKGILPKPKRDYNNWRLYSEEDIEEIKKRLIPSSN